MPRFFCCLMVLLLFDCAGSRRATTNSAASHNGATQLPAVMKDAISTINLPLSFEIKELEALLNQQLGDSLYSGGRSEDDRRLQMDVRKGGQIELEVGNNEIRYKIPLDLDIAYDLTLGTARAKGKIELDFATTYEIDSTWHLLTKTDLQSHRWIEQPRLQLGIVSLPIGTLSNFVIGRAEGAVERTIDQLAASKLALNEQVLKAWNRLHKSIQVSEEHQAWLRIQPQDMQMTALQTVEESIEATIILKAKPRLFFGEDPGPGILIPFPAFRYAEAAEGDFQLVISSLLTYEAAEALAKDAIVGEEFSSGRRSVTIDDLRLRGEGEEVVVEVDAVGSYNGTIALSGIPHYNSRRDRLEINKLDFQLETRNFLHRTAAWLFESRIKNTIQDQLNEQLTTNLSALHVQIRKELEQRELYPGLELHGDLNQLALSGADVVEAGIDLQVVLQGQLEIVAKALTQLNPD